MGLLHILLGMVIRTVVPQRAQDGAGKLLFWAVPLVLAAVLLTLIVNTDWEVASHNLQIIFGN